MYYKGDARVLVVDDSEVTLKVIRRLFIKQGINNVITALNASQALKIIQKANKPFSLIISDQNMPGMSGSELFERALTLTPDTRRILMTGHKESKDAAEAINIGSVNRYVLKPWDDDEFIKIIVQEFEKYNKTQEKIALTTITKNQNIRLYKTAKQMSQKSKAYKKALQLKETSKQALEKELEALSSENLSCVTFSGLENFLTGANVLRQDTFAGAFQLIKKRIVQMMDDLSGEEGFRLSSRENADDINHEKTAITLDDKCYPIIDSVIDHACLFNESAIVNFGIVSVPNSGIDDYGKTPELLDLALADGYLTQESFSDASAMLKSLEDSHDDHLVEVMLLDNQFLSRVNLSRVFVKQAFIKTRIKDRTLAKKLIAEDLVSQQDIDKAFARQMSLFMDSKKPVSIKIILIKAGVLPESFKEASPDDPSDETAGRAFQPDSQTLTGISMKDALNIEIIENKTKVGIRIDQALKKTISPGSIMDQLTSMGICHGLVGESLITGFLKYSCNSGDQFIVAMGKAPIPGKKAVIEHEFDLNYRQAGIVQSDGTIDFRERGDIPLVQEGDLLARKIPMRAGIQGQNVYGDVIPVEIMSDIPLKGDKGTRLSADGMELYAAQAGQPTRDSLGIISVFKDLTIDSDVDFETGHINFRGNVTVSGCVKEGFQVQCVDLTVNEINGGLIDISGNLNVSTGIINSTVKTQGDIQAKFINNSTVDAYGDIIIMREIMGSKVLTSGELVNREGRITAANLSAKNGMKLGQVGTDRSEISKLRIGIDDYKSIVTKDFNARLEHLAPLIESLKFNKQRFEERNFALHKITVTRSYDQEKLYREIETLKQQCIQLKGRRAEMLENRKESQRVKAKIDEIDATLKETFEEQDQLMNDIDQCDKQLQEHSKQYAEIVFERDAMQELSDFDPGNPHITVARGMMAGTTVKGPSASMIVQKDIRTCTILEIDSDDTENPDGKKIVIQTG